MNNAFWAGMAMLTAVTIPAVSEAGTLQFKIQGPDALSGMIAISFEPSTDQGTLPSIPANAYNPPNSFHVTGVSGELSFGSDHEVVDDVVNLNRVSPEPTNLLAPHDFSLFKVANGVDDGQGHISPGLHYDNLFYPGGSPQTATDYPLSGGIFDIYGLMFSLGNNEYVNLWSNGSTPGGTDYGFALTDGTDVLAYTNGVTLAVVPLPSSAPLLGAALLGLGAASVVARRRSNVAF